MSCGTCKYWRVDENDPDGDCKCFAFVEFSGEEFPSDVDPWDRVLECVDFTPKD